MFGNKRALTFGFEELGRLMSEATGGNFVLQIHYGETLGPSKEMLDGLSIGAFEAALISPGFTPGKLPVIEGPALPFLPMASIYHGAAMREAFLSTAAAKADVARWNSVIIMQVPYSTNEFVGKGKAPVTLADWKSKRVRALGGDARAMQLLGASATALPSTEIYGGLERGLLDAASSLFYAHAAFKLQEVTTWYTTNLSLSSPSVIISAGKKAFDALPPQYQKLMMDSVPASIDGWIKAFQEDDQKGIDAFKAKGLQAITYSEDELTRLRGLVRPIWDEWAADIDKRGFPGKQLLQTMLDGAKIEKKSGFKI
ncbi:MAG: TRAP transporter substrate-binding protein DctP [Alphaproteobacteria bacterium]